MIATELLKKYDELDIANNPKTCSRIADPGKERPGNPDNFCHIIDTKPYVVCVKSDSLWAPARALQNKGVDKVYPVSDKDILEFKVDQIREYEEEVGKRRKSQKT